MSTDKAKVMTTSSLGEAVKELFGLDLDWRLCILTQEVMSDEVVKAYNQIGSLARLETYRRIVEDFKNRTGCYAVNHLCFDLGNILDVGCGSGLLSLELAQQTAGDIVGVDLSSNMVGLANENLTRRSKERIEEIKILAENNHFFGNKLFGVKFKNNLGFINFFHLVYRL